MLNIPKQITQALYALERWGFDAYIAGSCVRELLLGKFPQDFDIVTDANLRQIKECFTGYRVNEDYKNYGIIRVGIVGMFIDISPYRLSTVPNNVVYADNLNDDLKMRGFSINSIAYNPKTGLIDPFDGALCIKDENAVLKSIENPNKCFKDNPERIFEALISTACYNHIIDKATSTALRENSELLNKLDKNIVRNKFNELILGRNSPFVLDEYKDVFVNFIPELKSTFGFRQYRKNHLFDVFVHTVKAISFSPPNLILRLSLLLHNIGKPDCFSLDENGTGHFYGHSERSRILTECILTRMGYDDDTIDTVCYIVKHHDDEIPENRYLLKKHLRFVNIEKYKLLIQCKISDTMAKAAHLSDYANKLKKLLDLVTDISSSNECYRFDQLAITRSELIELRLAHSSSHADYIINALLDIVLDYPRLNIKKNLIQIVRNGQYAREKS